MVMTNNWNIKNKVIDFRDFIKQSAIDSEVLKISIEEAFKKVFTTRCVTEENIEILRQKLIDDLEDFYIEYKTNDELILIDFRERINKRFGVNDER